MIAPMGDAGQDPGEFDAGTGGARDARRFAGIRLAPGFLPRHVLIYLYAAFFTVGLFAFISSFQAWLLNVNLRLPEQLQGRTVSALNFANELVALALVAPFGALADKIGRRAACHREDGFEGGTVAVCGCIALSRKAGEGWVRARASRMPAKLSGGRFSSSNKKACA